MRHLILSILFFLTTASVADSQETVKEQKNRDLSAVLRSLLRSGCLTQDSKTGVWVLYGKSEQMFKCQFEDIDIDQVELSDLRTTPVTLGC